jgi:hypothetical protein
MPCLRNWELIYAAAGLAILIILCWLVGSEERRQGAGPDEEEAGRSLIPDTHALALDLCSLSLAPRSLI